MVKLRTAGPLWLAQRADTASYATLKHDIAADVVIVGGGMSGAATAWMFTKHGVRVAVLEAQLVGHGSTAASTALLLQEPDDPLRRLVKRYGRAKAIRIWKLSRSAVRAFVSAVNEHRIACHLAHRDTVYYTTESRAIRSLRKEHRLRNAAGFPTAWLDETELRDATGIVGEGALRTAGNAQFDPYRACLGLMKVAARRGARIFERSSVTAIEKESAGVRVRTSSGSVSAAMVIVATGYATPAFRPLGGQFRMKHTYVVASAPIDALTRRERRLKDVMMWDVERPYHYARWTRDRRILLGGGDVNRTSDSRRRKMFTRRCRALHHHFERIMPGLRGIPIEYRWEGLFAMTPDGLPYIGPHPRYERHLFALGYGGNGMTLGFLGARFLVEMFEGRHSPDHALFAFDRF